MRQRLRAAEQRATELNAKIGTLNAEMADAHATIIALEAEIVKLKTALTQSHADEHKARDALAAQINASKSKSWIWYVIVAALVGLIIGVTSQ